MPDKKRRQRPALGFVPPDLAPAAARKARATIQRHGRGRFTLTVIEGSAADAEQAVKQACKTKAVLVVASLSHLAHSTRQCVRFSDLLRRAKADLVAIDDGIDTTTAQGKVFFTAMSALSRLEHDRALRHVPFGYAIGPDLEHAVVDPAERAVVVSMIDWQSQGWSAAKIAEELNRTGAKSRAAGPWDAKAVKAVLDDLPTSRWGPAEADGA